MIKPYQFIGILGIITTFIGLVAVIFNDKVVGFGLVTAGMSDIGISVAIAQGVPQNGS